MKFLTRSKEAFNFSIHMESTGQNSLSEFFDSAFLDIQHIVIVMKTGQEILSSKLLFN